MNRVIAYCCVLFSLAAVTSCSFSEPIIVAPLQPESADAVQPESADAVQPESADAVQPTMDSSPDLRLLQASGNCVKCNLSNENLRDAILTWVDLSGADLTATDLTKAHLTKANLTNANLTNANLTEAFLKSANLDGANLSGVMFCKTTMPDGTINNSGC